MPAQYHATRAQQAFLVRHQVDPGYAGDNVVQAWRLDRCLDLDKFIECLRTVFSTAAPLGDTFHFSEGEWIVRRGPTPVPEVVDLKSRVVLGDKSGEDEESVICQRLADEVDRGIDVASGPLCTVRFFVGAHAHYLAMVGSHLIVDAYTGYALVTAVSRLYNGTADSLLLERLPLGPEAFREPPVSGRALERLTADLGEVRGFGTLTADGLTSGAALSGTTRSTRMPAALHEKFLVSSRVKEFGSVPLFLAAHAKTLSVLGDRSDVVISVPLANRRGIDQRGACGDFVNTQMMHLAVDTQTTHDLLRTCSIRLRGLQRYQHVGIDDHRASILPSLPSIDYVETHGTGTALGDAIELRSLRTGHESSGALPTNCRLGAVKANLGHLDAAAGIAGLIKTALVVQHQLVPGQPDFGSPSADLASLSGHYDMSGSTVRAEVRHAAVSSFGMGGTDAHAILVPAPADDRIAH